MRSFAKKLLLPLTIGLSLSAAVQAKEPPRGPMFKMFDELQLSAQQRQDIRTLFKQGREDRQVFRQDGQLLREQKQAVIEAADWDQQAALALLSEEMTARRAAMWARAQMDQAVWNLLTESQREVWAEMQEEGFDRPERTPFNGRWLRKLDLNEAQQQALSELQAQAKMSREKNQDIRERFAEQQLALIEQGGLTEQAWTSLYEQYQSQFQAAALEGLKQRHGFYHLLTAEQQAKLEQFKQRHKARKDRSHPGRLRQ
ncbi:Spy/CpxP family protein refolding chaperone [Bowmanella pacifica]|uniref:LTXXQ motif family protein n=1 Tax=Bowmanella pacifica TaxID=502051 RepID=A0A917YVB5_9ALTE|nr:Spy/CpxP family protein refolding chaperone [Bowmanella pacifica]GGO65739.1 hypothetical protein GCM10010982_08250 [Bowmanella pacifica]